MIYDDEINSFSFMPLFRPNVTIHHEISLVVTQNRHNFRHKKGINTVGKAKSLISEYISKQPHKNIDKSNK
jgi:hypothetical protein